jgi:hypothetical protein
VDVFAILSGILACRDGWGTNGSMFSTVSDSAEILGSEASPLRACGGLASAAARGLA